MASKSPPPHLSPQQWDSIIQSFHNNNGDSTNNGDTSISLLTTLLKPHSPLSLKLNLLIFLDEFSSHLIINDVTTSFIPNLIETLRSVIQSPIDNVSVTYSLKDQFLVSTTSTLITAIEFSRVRVSEIEDFVAILLTIINRPNHGVDRVTRGVACECLRELEREFPCLLSEIVGHLWEICRNERTHVCQSYLLLLLEVVHHIVIYDRLSCVGSGTSVSLVPFNVPSWVRSRIWGGEGVGEGTGLGSGGSDSKELMRVVAFLLEWTNVLTPCGMVEFMSMVMPLAVALDLQRSLLKVQFSGLVYNYDPLLWHVVVMMYGRFPDTFSGQEGEVCRRLVLVSKEGQQPLVFRLLVLHWLLGFVERRGVGVGKGRLVVGMASGFYPSVYDALALKSLKLDLLALCSSVVADGQGSGKGVSAVKYFEDGLVCVSAFKWLPPWSTETAVAFRTFHKFLIGASSHLDTDLYATDGVMDSAIFRAIQMMLVDLLLHYPKLVPVVVTLIDRLLLCQKHHWFGENLLQTVDEHLLPKVVINYRLSSYFRIFDRIGQNDTIPPQRLLELLMKVMMFLVQNHGPDTGLKSWSHGSKVVGICRTMLMHHHSSRLFMGLSRLLAFTALYFPDLEVRDNARIYLRMLICIPGKKLRHMLNLGDQLVGVLPSPHVQSPRLYQDLKKSRSISSYIHIERVIPLLVKQSWSLSLPALGYEVSKHAYFNGIKDNEPPINGKDSGDGNNIEVIPDTKRIYQPQEPLRVMDSKVSEIIDLLRMHFSCIPDFRHMSGLKIRIPCTLGFKSEPYCRIWGSDRSGDDAKESSETLPAMFAVVLKFSSSAPYGSIPSYHIPFILGESSSGHTFSTPEDNLDIVPIDTSVSEMSSSASKTEVMIELEPREPMPGLVEVLIDANAENGQVIHGKLQDVPVGIEDMFLKASVPSNILEDSIPSYYSDLFNALWEACGTASNTGRETFSLKGGKGFAAISGTQSVKLLEVPSTFSIRVIERCLAPFVVSVIGGTLVEIVKEGGFIKEVTWMDAASYNDNGTNSVTDSDRAPLFLTYLDNKDDDKDGEITICKSNMGCFLVLIFLPPRYHLLFRIEVSEFSTLVRIRTDHWPCLAYVDEYLEALFSS